MRPANKRHRLLITWTIRCGFATLVLVAITFASRYGSESAVLPGAEVEGVTNILKRDGDDLVAPIRFQDVTAAVGVEFHHFPEPRRSMLPEDMGSGVAAADYDNDGFTDLFFVNFAGSILNPLLDTDTQAHPGRCRLYRNVGGERFEDVTAAAGVSLVAHAMGAAWGDYDNDDDLDLYVTAFGPNTLYQNLGDGTFRDVTDSSGMQDTRFGAGCTWADYDRDGNLDLYVSNYVDFIRRPDDRSRTQRQYSTEQPYTLNPSAYLPQPNALFRNNGDGTFENVASFAGIADPQGRSLSAAWVDFSNDGWPDLYVANDVSNNGVFLNRGDGTFDDVGPSSLAADYRGAMGIAPVDFDDDLDMDLLITHWIAQENALFRNMTIDEFADPDRESRLWFMDEADQRGLGQISLDMVGWATAFTDFDNDARADLWLINGSTLEQSDDHAQLVPHPPLLFWYHPTEGFVEIAKQANERFSEPFVGRGAAALDYNRDGRIDLAVLVHGGDAVVLKNTSDPAGNYLRLDLRQRGGNTHAIGARAYVTIAGKIRMAEVRAGASYLSQDEHTLHFGAGSDVTVDELRIVWPDGIEETHNNITLPNNLRFTHDARYPVPRNSEARGAAADGLQAGDPTSPRVPPTVAKLAGHEDNTDAAYSVSPRPSTAPKGRSQ